MYPILSDTPSIFSFSIYTSPFVFSSKPVIIDNNVDFPHPLGPIMLTNSPFSTEKLMSFNASISPIFFLICFSYIFNF